MIFLHFISIAACRRKKESQDSDNMEAGDLTASQDPIQSNDEGPPASPGIISTSSSHAYEKVANGCGDSMRTNSAPRENIYVSPLNSPGITNEENSDRTLLQPNTRTSYLTAHELAMEYSSVSSSNASPQTSPSHRRDSIIMQENASLYGAQLKVDEELEMETTITDVKNDSQLECTSNHREDDSGVSTDGDVAVEEAHDDVTHGDDEVFTDGIQVKHPGRKSAYQVVMRKKSSNRPSLSQMTEH